MTRTAGRQLTAKFREELAKKPQTEEATQEQAVEQTEQFSVQGIRKTAAIAKRDTQGAKELIQHQYQAHVSRLKRDTPPTPQERMKQAAIKEKQEQVRYQGQHKTALQESFTAPMRQSGSAVPPPLTESHRVTTRGLESSGATVPKQRPTQRIIKTRNSNGGYTGHKTVVTPAKQYAQRQGQGKLIQRNTQMTKKTMKAFAERFAAAISHAGASVAGTGSILACAAVLVLLLSLIVAIGAVIASPFGIFFSNEQSAPGTMPLNAAVAQINAEYATVLEELQEGNYDSIEINGQPPDWREVIAVFASKTAGAENGVDVATLDADRVELLRTVFWDMTEIATEIETISDEDGTATILHIMITPKTAHTMRASYHFTKYQNDALTELLDNIETLGQLLGDLTIRQADAVELLESLPEDLSPERREVIKHALSLVGKVNYFWGGKSFAMGWDSRWGTTTLVTSPGGSTTGTYQPYGLDCSGFVDWVYYNASGGTYIASHGGGAQAQHNHCTPIRWTDALPGDLVFYPDDSHVGIVGGYDPDGNLRIIHCASGWNNVIITGREDFTSIGRPDYYE